MFFSSFRNKEGLKGSKPTNGEAIGHVGQWKWNLQERGRHLGVSDNKLDEFRTAVKTKDAAALSPFSGIIMTPQKAGPDGKGVPLDDTEEVPLEFGGRTYQVGRNGIKIVNEKILDEIVTESIERENYITDVCEMFLYAGDSAVAVVSAELFKTLKDGLDDRGIRITAGCLPSQIRHTTDAAQYGAKYLEMKKAVELYIDRIVIPEATLEKSRAVQKHGINAQRLRTEAGAGVDIADA